MLGSIIGDIIGSVYEGSNMKTTDFPLFSPRSIYTDDTVLTVATADALMSGRDFREIYQEYFHRYPNAGYGGGFINWARSRKDKPYYSFGNGSAMRVSPVGFAGTNLEQVLQKAKESAEVSHNHPEGIKGAQAVAAAVFLARTGLGKEEIARFITSEFGYVLTEPIDSIRRWYRFDVSCQGSVPQAIRAFMESSDFESAVRLAVSVGGDTDTIACMAGGIAEAFYGQIPDDIVKSSFAVLDVELADVIYRFYKSYPHR
jgi:ADP-ribosylglycohydrolase